MLRFWKLYQFRKNLRTGDHVMVETSKGKKEKFKIILAPSLGEVTVHNVHTRTYESFPLTKVYPV